MNPINSSSEADQQEEVSALIETLHATGLRLEELTAGEVDTVTDRRGRTVMLRRAQDHMRFNDAAKQLAILNALPAHIALLDAQGCIVSVNQAWRQFADANSLQAPAYGVGISYLDICDNARGDSAAEAQQVAAGIRSVLAGAVKSVSLEYTCHSPTEQRWFLMAVTPLVEQFPHGVVVMHLNITKRKQTEQKFKDMLESAPDAMVIFNRDTEMVLVNAQAVKLFGWGREELLGQKIDMLVPERFRSQHPKNRNTFFVQPRARPMGAGVDLFGLRKDGSEFPVEISLSPLETDDGTVVMSAIRDITERKQTEQALRTSEERFKTMFVQAPFGIALIDSLAGHIYEVNSRFAEIAGRSMEEMANIDWLQITHPDDVQADLENMALLNAGKINGFQMEKRYLRPDGTVVWIDMTINPFKVEDKAHPRHLCMIRDITERKDAEKHLVQMEGRYHGLLEAAPDAMVVVNQGGEIVLLNLQAEKQFGYRRDELVGQKVKNIIPEGFAERLVADGLRSAADALAQQIGTGIELTGRRKDGSEFPIEIMLSPLESAEGILVTAAIRDITERKGAQDRIAHLNRVYAILSGITTLIVRVRDRDELFKEACRVAVSAGGFRMAMIAIVDRGTMALTPIASAGKDEALMNAIKNILSSPEDAPKTMGARAIREQKAVVSNDSQNDPQVVFSTKYADSGVFSMAVLPLMVANEAVGVLALYASEVDFFQQEEMKLLTELVGDIGFAMDHIDKQERLNYLAYYDVITGLANRTLFQERVAQYMRSAAVGGHQLALFLIDLERFKNINDSLGTHVGDELLRQVAQWLTHNAAGDVNLLARIGADHFAVVLPVVKSEGNLTRLMSKWIELFLGHPFHLNDAVFRISAKVGVAVFPDDGSDADTLFKHAEAALKKAKESHERYLFYTQTMTDAGTAKFTLENQLRQALDNDEFVLHYQPKVDLATGRMTSAEALIRWNDPRSGLVPPDRFIPILEETGMIHEVGRWAMRQAIRDYLRWRAEGLPAVRIAVNVSPLQLRDPGFIAEVRNAISIDKNAAAAGLELEITESLIMENVQHSIVSLRALRDMGISIAIDDFGTGFSSLSYLSKFPLDALKIDRSFVIGMTDTSQGQALVSTIIQLAHALKLKVIAEGVETEKQAWLLRGLACDEMQGYLFSKAVPVEIFEAKFLKSPVAV